MTVGRFQDGLLLGVSFLHSIQGDIVHSSVYRMKSTMESLKELREDASPRCLPEMIA